MFKIRIKFEVTWVKNKRVWCFDKSQNEIIIGIDDNGSAKPCRLGWIISQDPKWKKERKRQGAYLGKVLNKNHKLHKFWGPSIH